MNWLGLLYLLLMNVITDPEISYLLFSNSLRFCLLGRSLYVKFNNIPKQEVKCTRYMNWLGC